MAEKKQSPLKALLSIEKTIRKGTLCAKYCLKYYCLRRLASFFFLWRQNARVMTILMSANGNGHSIVVIPNSSIDKTMSKSEVNGSKTINSGIEYPNTPNDDNHRHIKDDNAELTMEQRRQNVLMYAKQILSQTRMSNPTSTRSKPRSKGSFSSTSASSPIPRVYMDTEASRSRSYGNSGDRNTRSISPASVETYRSRKSDSAINYRRNSWGHYTDNSSISRRGRVASNNSQSRGRRSLSSESRVSTVRAKSADSKGSVVSSSSKYLSHTQSSKKKTAAITREKREQRRTYTNYRVETNGSSSNYDYYDRVVRRNQHIDRAQMELFRVGGYSENKKYAKGWRDSLRL